MSNEHETQKEIRRQKEVRQILRLLEMTARIIETSAITDQFSGGEERSARQFNNALELLTDLGAVPEGLFERLEDHDASFGDICFACHQVAAYVKESCADDFVDFTQIKKTIGDELKDVREVVRQSVPSFLKDVWGGQTQEDNTDVAETVEVTSDEDEDTTSVEQRIGKLEGQMETVVEILQEIRSQQIEQNKEL
ncbi:MAG: hypothetical protein OXD49_05970 [Candidatus Poribacteria bacterium]|nr:hypothetical protein [Candidatus Poribacteria bacterium]